MNAIKYLYRWKSKNGVEDIMKACTYLEKFLELETKKIGDEQNGRTV